MALTSDFLQTSVVFLSAAVVAVPLAQRSGLGSVLGYLLAGVAIGPWGLGLISDVDAILHFAELGVVLLLFLIGLELNPKKLWQMRSPPPRLRLKYLKSKGLQERKRVSLALPCCCSKILPLFLCSRCCRSWREAA